MINNVKYHENKQVLNTFIKKSKKYPILLNEHASCPDFSIGILSQIGLKKIIERFENFDNLIDIFNINFNEISNHQIVFGYIFTPLDI